MFLFYNCIMYSHHCFSWLIVVDVLTLFHGLLLLTF